jgi:hypothetical protein
MIIPQWNALIRKVSLDCPRYEAETLTDLVQCEALLIEAGHLVHLILGWRVSAALHGYPGNLEPPWDRLAADSELAASS